MHSSKVESGKSNPAFVSTGWLGELKVSSLKQQILAHLIFFFSQKASEASQIQVRYR